MLNNNENTQKATIKDVAKAAGVSIATVSRVINKNYYVSPEINLKVQNAIVQTGYVPDSIARTMKSNNTNLIGFIVSNISNPHMMTIARAIEKVIRESNYNLLVCSTENDPTMELKYLNAFISRRISGLILHSTGGNEEYIAQKISSTLPTVLMFRHNECKEFVGDTVDTDGRRGSYKLAKHLIECGHRRIGLLGGNLEVSTGRDRFQGYQDAMREFGLEINPELHYFGDFSELSGIQGACRLFTTPNPPTALLCLANMAAVGAMKYFREKGIQVPDDVSVVSYGDIENVELMWVNPTRIPQIPSVLGQKAGELVLDRIQHPNRPNREATFDTDLIIGNSVKNYL